MIRATRGVPSSVVRAAIRRRRVAANAAASSITTSAAASAAPCRPARAPSSGRAGDEAGASHASRSDTTGDDGPCTRERARTRPGTGCSRPADERPRTRGAIPEELSTATGDRETRPLPPSRERELRARGAVRTSNAASEPDRAGGGRSARGLTSTATGTSAWVSPGGATVTVTSCGATGAEDAATGDGCASVPPGGPATVPRPGRNSNGST
jgi:hypothetical protein